MLTSNRAQQVLEYILIFVVVVVVLLAFVGPTGPFRGKVQEALDIVLNEINRETANLAIER